jgi:amidase
VKDSRLAVQAKELGHRVRWKLDLEKGIATPDLATEHLTNFTVPLKPMLGCVGVAPDFGFAPSLRANKDAMAATWTST